MGTRRSFLASGLAVSAARLSPAEAPKTPPPVRYRTLGKTGLKVSEFGLSTEALSDVSIIQLAVDLGITFFDTARSYEGGSGERALGAALGAKRKSVVISTRSYGKDRKAVEADLDTSLKELKTDYVDLWYLGNHDTPVSADLLEFQAAAKKAGKIRFAAFSTHRTGKMRDFIKSSKFDVVMVPYNFALGTPKDPFKMDGTGVEAALEEFHKAGMGVVAMKVMAGGYRDPRAPKDTLEDVHKRPNAFVSALRWALRTPNIQTTSVSVRDRDHVIENMQAMAQPFSDADAKTLTTHLDYIRRAYCRMCYECEGQCPQGLPVADMLRFLMYADGYKRFDLGYGRFKTLPEQAKAVRCEDCGHCSVACPNGVAVRDRLIRAQNLFC